MVAVLPAVTSPTQAHVAVLGSGLLAGAAVVARIHGAGLAVSDADAVCLVADQVDLLLPYHQPADAADEAGVDLRVLGNGIVAGHPADEQQLLQVQPLLPAHRDPFVSVLAVHQHRSLLSITLQLDRVPFAQGDRLVCADHRRPGAKVEAGIQGFCFSGNLATLGVVSRGSGSTGDWVPELRVSSHEGQQHEVTGPMAELGVV